ncbi:MAG: DUF4352 domain-containing protein [Chloroflexota bacterium]|nr:DUF4352 domain-containing protein [Chloroflexota bacterium]
MRKMLLALLAMLFLMGGSASLVATAQDDATPDATPEGEAEEAVESTNPVDPAIGDTVTYYGQNGEPVGEITVTEITRNWEDYGEFEEPDPDVEYIAFTIEVESLTSRGAIDVDPYRFQLQSPAGFVYTTSFVQGAEGLEPAVVTESTSLAEGETLEGLLVFEVFADEELAHLFWTPDSSFLLTIANLEGE